MPETDFRKSDGAVAYVPDGANVTITMGGVLIVHPDHEPRFIPLAEISKNTIERAFATETHALRPDHA